VVYGAVCAVHAVVHGVVYVVAAVAAASHKFPRLLIRCKKMCSAPHKMLSLTKCYRSAKLMVPTN
jgi:hypothetical protein